MNWPTALHHIHCKSQLSVYVTASLYLLYVHIVLLVPNVSSGAKGPSINLHKKRSEPDNGASRPDSGFCNASNFGRSCRLWAHTILAFPLKHGRACFYRLNMMVLLLLLVFVCLSFRRLKDAWRLGRKLYAWYTLCIYIYKYSIYIYEVMYMDLIK